MLDIHPPHHTPNTWRDFFLHIATIVVGLIIAVGIEQTVELFHHRHQRHQLEQDLQDDYADNRDFIIADFQRVQAIMDWSQAQAAVVDLHSAGGSLIIHALHQADAFDVFTPDTGIWLAAKANGQVSLLPVWEQTWLTDWDRNEAQTFNSDTSHLGHLRTSLSLLNQSLLGHAAPRPDGMLDLSSLSPTQRATVARQLWAVSEAARAFQRGLIGYSTYNEFLFNTHRDHSGINNDDSQVFLKIFNKTAADHPTSFVFTTH